MSKKICNKCGEINSGSVLFCSSCQSSLKDVEITKESYEPTRSGTRYSRSRSEYAGESNVVSIGAWVGILILLSIPFVNLAALFFIAFGSINESLKNFGKAILLLVLIGIILMFMFRGCGGYYY